ERQRQVEKEGWTSSHDDRYINGELSKAAFCYQQGHLKSRKWPWHKSWWKPTNTIRNHVKSGALLVADKERIERRIIFISNEIDRLKQV
ncbi:MAG: hypothetical protein V4549_17805, partial [Bacteroidota bacterium]